MFLVSHVIVGLHVVAFLHFSEALFDVDNLNFCKKRIIVEYYSCEIPTIIHKNRILQLQRIT